MPPGEKTTPLAGVRPEEHRFSCRPVAMTLPALPHELARRVLWEAAAVHTLFPGRCRLGLEPDGRPAWHTVVPVEGGDLPVVVSYPAAYPAVPPRLETTLPLP